jgi:multiple sugar transport system ATP-binding protein
MAQIVLDHATRRFPDGTLGVDDLSLEIVDGEFMVLVGPSGSGKSTALRMIAGLEEITEGIIRIGENVVNDLPPRDRDIAMVFQNYALYPHMTVYDNMAFGLSLRGVPKQDIQTRVEQAADLLDIRDYLHRKPRQLSGGQRQRVAMGRAIVREPTAFLMDEPLSNLDAKLRVQMRTEIERLHRRLRTTTVYVTHDQVEAVTMADRVAVLRSGRLQQVDTPQRLYDHPVNVFVGGFIGSPAMNMVVATLQAENGQVAVRFAGHELMIPSMAALNGCLGGEVILGIRPEDFEDPELVVGTGSVGLVEVDVTLVETLGAETVAYFDVEAPKVRIQDTLDLEADKVKAGVPTQLPTKEGHSVFTARLNPKTRIGEGQKTKLAVDLERLYFFHPETAVNLL